MKSLFPLLATFVVGLALALPLPGQTATTPTLSNDDIVRLSPFMVDFQDDASWTATTTLSGNRTKQELEKVPVTVDVITEEFIKDLGLESMEDAAQFVAGLTVQPRMESRNDDSRISYRGLTGASTTSRNFFMWYVPSDTYNVERFDFNKGSNSLMFGDSAPGGQATIYTKRPRRTPLADLYATYTTYGSSRVQLDLSEPIGKTFGIRLNSVDRVDRTYVHHNFQRLIANDLALSWQPTPTTMLLIEGERGKYVRRRADNAIAILDTSAPGRGFNNNNRWYYTSDGTLIQRPSASVPTVDTTAAGGNSVSLLSGQSAVVSLPGGVKKTFYGFSRYLDVLGSNDYLDRPYNVFSSTLDQAIGKLELEISYNQQFQHQDRNDNSFGTSQSPPVISVDSTGRPYVDETGVQAFKIFGNIVKAGRVSAAYPLELGHWMKQYVVISGLRQKDFGFNRRFFLANDAQPGNLMNQVILERAYLDDPRIDTSAYWDQFQQKNLPTTSAFHAGLYESYVNTGPFVDIRYNRNASVSLSGDYFGGRLSSLLGVSWSRISRKIPSPAAYTLDARGLVTPWGDPDHNPQGYVYDPSYDLGARSEMAGLSYQLLQGDSLSLNAYGVYSQSFNWQSGQTFFGQVLGPILGNTREVGFKGDFFERKLFVTFAAFDIQRQNVAYVWTPDSLSATNLEDLINPNNLKVGDPGYLSVVNGLNSERHTVNSDEGSRGVEITLQSQRYLGLQGRVTAAATRVHVAPDFTEFKSLLAAAIARTNAANAPGGNPALAESATNIANGLTILDANTTTSYAQGRRSAPYSGSFALDYEVPRIHGLRTGANGVLTPNYVVAIFNARAYKGGSQFPLGFYATYNRKIWKHLFTFRASVQNALDPLNSGSEFRKTGATGFNSARGTPNSIYRYIDPPTYTTAVDIQL